MWRGRKKRLMCKGSEVRFWKYNANLSVTGSKESRHQYVTVCKSLYIWQCSSPPISLNRILGEQAKKQTEQCAKKLEFRSCKSWVWLRNHSQSSALTSRQWARGLWALQMCLGTGWWSLWLWLHLSGLNIFMICEIEIWVALYFKYL